MISASVYVGTSVDGFIARSDDRLDFLDSAGPSDGDMGFGEFMASVDVLVMGRRTFDVVRAMVVDQGIDWPYGDTRIVVLTHRPLDIPEAIVDVVEVADHDPPELLRELEARGFEHAYIDGGQTIQAFLRAGLVDQMIVTRVPVLVGAGIALFGALDADVALDHQETIVFSNGCVQTRYRVSR